MLSGQGVKLVGISFLILFLELVVVRLVGTEIRIFAYLSNLILLATFVGVGVGMLIKKRFSLVVTEVGLMLLAVWLVTQYIVRLPNLEFKVFSGITELLAPLSEAYIWNQVDTFSKTGIVIGLGLTLVLVGGVVVMFIPLGQYLGEALSWGKKPLKTYSINVGASIAGMWVFQLMSVVGMSPFLGLVMAQVLGLALVKDKVERGVGLAAVMATVVLLTPKTAPQLMNVPQPGPITIWSPYQKLKAEVIKPTAIHQPDGVMIEVNNVSYMGLLDLSPYALKGKEEMLKGMFRDEPETLKFGNQYALPYMFNPEAKEVLIIGGGGGNDAAGAVAAGVPNITVVEIDPQIVNLGSKYHPEQPYGKESVEVIVDDGRAFLQRADKKYDLVIMSLADSHTLSSSLTNLRLDNYLYTLESLRLVRGLLTEDGVAVVTFEVTRPWIGARLKQTVKLAFEQEPRVFEVRSKGAFGWGGIAFVAGKRPETVERILRENPGLAKFIDENKRDYTAEINPLSDDWPYLYLDKPRVPLIHLLIAVVMVGAMVAVVKRGGSGQKLSWSFFWWGVGFMLLEFQNISKASLVFGSTWVTNLFIITGVLGLVLAANVAVVRKWLGMKVAFGGLMTSLGLQLVVPVAWFNQWQGLAKVLGVMMWANLPHFFGGVVFAWMWLKTKNRASAWGSNLLGAVVGGLVEMLSFRWGVTSLMYVVIAAYGLGYWRRGEKKLGSSD